MNHSQTYLTLLAWKNGAPLANRQALHLPRVEAQNTLLLAFVRMAGEVLPWGFAIGHPGETPRIVSIPEPRNVDLVAQLCAQLAGILLPHVGHPEHAAESSFDPATRQLWLPGASHLDLLHLLALRFSHTRSGDPERARTLRALARAAGFLFRESSRPGALSALDASACLRELFVFPAEPARCAHLGYLLGWLQPEQPREQRQALASEAGQFSVSDTLDPSVERDHLEPLLSAWHKGSSRERTRAEKAIQEVLHGELERRWRWTEEAWWLVQNDARPVGEKIEELEKLSREEHRQQYLRFEQQILEQGNEAGVFVPHPETDHHSAAATSRYFFHIHAQEVHASSLLESDAGRRAEALASGEIIAGTLVHISEVREGRAARIHWTVEAPASDLCKLREGSKVFPAGQRGRSAVIQRIEVQGETRLFELEITGWKRKGDDHLAAGDQRLRGMELTLLPVSETFFSRQRSFQAWKADGPGAWLSHGKNEAPAAATPGDGRALLRLVRSMVSPRGLSVRKLRTEALRGERHPRLHEVSHGFPPLHPDPFPPHQGHRTA